MIRGHLVQEARVTFHPQKILHATEHELNNAIIVGQLGELGVVQLEQQWPTFTVVVGLAPCKKLFNVPMVAQGGIDSLPCCTEQCHTLP